MTTRLMFNSDFPFLFISSQKIGQQNIKQQYVSPIKLSPVNASAEYKNEHLQYVIPFHTFEALMSAESP